MERYIVAQHRNTINGQWMTGNKVNVSKFKIVETVKPWRLQEAILMFLTGALIASVVCCLVVKFV